MFSFVLPRSLPAWSSHAPQSLNRVWKKRETWGLKVRLPAPPPIPRLPLPPLKKKNSQEVLRFCCPQLRRNPALPRFSLGCLRLACRTRLSLLTVVALLLLLATFPLHCIAWLCACAAAAVSMASCFYVVTWKLLQLWTSADAPSPSLQHTTWSPTLMLETSDVFSSILCLLS